MEEAACLRILAHGKLTLTGQFTRSSNYTFLAACSFEGQSLQAVYKPARGQQPLWDFAPETLPKRETAAYLFCRYLGWDSIPPTVYRIEDLPADEGSLQLFIEHDPQQNYFTLTEIERETLQALAVFDLLANNADRKGGHILRDQAGRLWAIDHALCFHAEPKLRTVIWDFAGRRIPDPLLQALEGLTADLSEGKPLWKDLENYLEAKELRAIYARCAALLAEKTFPFPSHDRRAFPWPPV
ncbi:MAG TPA: SCO1664 family protein [Anaerolineaceae bacterium]|nr:SCO1664 family protein [Anaerolineaceae bacterium]HQH57228.1 SCO1664 family protein [Anaerolineaceae bacterium]HQK03005.1 SCO1664 family protein [Anaerolineaceae bacterium]